MPGVKKINAAGIVSQLDIIYLKGACEYFNCDYAHNSSDYIDSTDSLISLILNTASKLGQNKFNTIDGNVNTETLFCFDSNGKMICTAKSFNPSLHRIVFPDFLKTLSVALTHDDKLRLLAQANYFNDPLKYEMADMTWEELVLPQIQSILKFKEISYNKADSNRDLKRRLFGSPSFANHVQNDGNSTVRFTFCKDDPFSCQAIDSIPSESDPPLPKLHFEENNECVKHSSRTPVLQITNSGHTSDFLKTSGAVYHDKIADRLLNLTETVTTPNTTKEINRNYISSSQPCESSLEAANDSNKVPENICNSSISHDLTNETISLNESTDSTPEINLPEFSVDSYLDFSVVQKKKQGIVDGICTACTRSDIENETLSCFLCSYKIHYCCYKSRKNKRPICKTTWEKCSSSPNHRWFCNNCSQISFEDILQAISAHTKEKVSLMLQEEQANVDNQIASATALSSLPDYSINSPEPSVAETLKLEIVDELKVIVKAQIDSMKEELSYMISLASDPNKSDTPVIYQQKPSYATSYATAAHVTASNPSIMDISNISASSPLPSRHHSSKVNNKNLPTIPKPSKSKEINVSKFLVDPKMSIIIKNITDKRVIGDSTTLKSEFNKLFNRMKIVSCKKTRYGNVLLQLSCEDDIETVISRWQPSNFKDPESESGSVVIRMTDQSYKKVIGVMKSVPVDLSDGEITQCLHSASYSGASVKRFQRNGNPLTSIKITFASANDLTRAIAAGIAVEHLLLEVVEFQSKKRPMQCHNCKKYGHPIKWCQNKKRVCGFCTADSHHEASCPVKDDSTNHKCPNCQGNHTAWSTDCPVYIKQLTLTENRLNNEA